MGRRRIVFSPTSLPAGKVGARYQAVIEVAVDGHHPTLGKDYPSYTVACYGADGAGKYFDDCSKLPPGLKVTTPYTHLGCAPPPRFPACLAVSGVPRKAGRYSFRLSAPDPDSPGARGIVRKYSLVVQ